MTRRLNENSPIFPKSSQKVVKVVFNERIMFFKIAQVSTYILAAFEETFVTQNLKISPNLVTLLER